ncbi:MAG: hypothetical protein AB1847_15645 [bacterium]
MTKKCAYLLICSLTAFILILGGCSGEEGGKNDQPQANNNTDNNPTLLIGQWILEDAPAGEDVPKALLSIEADSTWKYWDNADAAQFIEPDRTGTWAIANGVLTYVDIENEESESATFSVTEEQLVLDFLGSEDDHWEYGRYSEESASENTEEISQESLDAMINAALKALQDSDSPEDLEAVEESMAYVTEDEGNPSVSRSLKLEMESQTERKRYLAVPIDFECGTMFMSGLTYNFEFTGDSTCVFHSGNVILEVLGNGNITVTYEDLTSDYCTLNGVVLVEKTDDTATTTYTFESFNSCGHTLDGTYTVIKDKDTGEIVYAYGQHSGVYSIGNHSATVTTNLSSDDQGNYDGTAAVSLGNYGTYTFNLSNVYLDANCSLPTSGTMTMTGQRGKTLQVSFEGSSCDNPAATLSSGSWQHTVNLNALVSGE